MDKFLKNGIGGVRATVAVDRGQVKTFGECLSACDCNPGTINGQSSSERRSERDLATAALILTKK